ncbi:hypothetical protein [Corallococcus aberystwythensis]|uniref:Uncharacterized protein n=1 Tax=Corallococcus aberystwythensis TaxID=2316722 RepID=A0A3A8QEL0_9BACT|nr:hypothetical protein [Corallococcus aberystwythensis]RKH67086.1 hypothetical protein D7W81_14385 [Corallococcus aberystwythensis]
MPHNAREYGLHHADRVAEIERKFGPDQREPVLARLSRVTHPTEPLLGAIVFLARQGHVEDIDLMVSLANQDASKVLDAATVKAERG